MRGLFQIAVLLPIALTAALPTGPGYKARQLDANTQLDHLDGQISRRSPVKTRTGAGADTGTGSGGSSPDRSTSGGGAPGRAQNTDPLPARGGAVSPNDAVNNPHGLTDAKWQSGGLKGKDSTGATVAALDGRQGASGLDAAQMAGGTKYLGEPLKTPGPAPAADTKKLAANLGQQTPAKDLAPAGTVPLANAEWPPRQSGFGTNAGTDRTFATIPLDQSNRRTPNS